MSAPSTRASSTPDPEAVYLYGLVRDPDEAMPDAIEGLDGVRDEPVRLVPHRGLAALVSAAPGDLASGRKRDLLAHARVLEQVSAATTVLPMQFGMTLADQQAVIDELLEDDHQRWVALLARFTGYVELTVKGYHDEDAMLRHVAASDPEVRRQRERPGGSVADRMRLGEAVANALERHRRTDVDMVLERLAPLSEKMRENPAVHEAMTLNASFLVDREETVRFDREVDALGRQIGERMRLHWVGPHPPYTFVAEED